MMETVYISQERCAVSLEGEHLRLSRHGSTISTIPVIGLRTIILFDSVHLTAPALSFLLGKSVDIIYMSKGGKIKGRVLSAKGGGAVLRIAQHSTFIDMSRRLEISKYIVAAKIDNQMSLIRRYKYRDTNPQFDSHLFEMEQYKKSLRSANSINEVMGFEGVSARHYWNCFKSLLKDPVFVRRDYRPAPDYVNALLNLGYSFLANEITTSLIVKNFDLEIGFLHSVHYGRNSLALDIMEEFRALFIDAWILSLVNKSQIKAEHFKIVNDDYRLDDDGFKKFCKIYHERLPDWREKFQKQANNLKIALIEGKPYEPYRE